MNWHFVRLALAPSHKISKWATVSQPHNFTNWKYSLKNKQDLSPDCSAWKDFAIASNFEEDKSSTIYSNGATSHIISGNCYQRMELRLPPPS